MLRGNVQLFPSLTFECIYTVRNNYLQMRFNALLRRPQQSSLRFMTQRKSPDFRRLPVRSILWRLLILLFVGTVSGQAIAEPSPTAASAYSAYIKSVEARLAQQHRSRSGFLAPAATEQQSVLRLRRGELIVEQLTPETDADFPGALLHHWRATAFAPGAKAADIERLLRNFNRYPQNFSPQVLQARILTQHDDRMQATMRVRQQHVLTVVLDTTYDIVFGRLDPQHGYSNSQSTRIAEIDQPGTRNERALSASEEHGFLWRQNTYWSYEERDGGVYLQIESVSLTRAIPTGLGWAIRPFVESVPRESLEFTLRSACNALRR
jgi:hypothetical protein